jgi:diguanylate cyclase
MLVTIGSAGLVLTELPPTWDHGSIDEPVTASVTCLVAIGLLICVSKLYSDRGTVSEEDLAWRLILIGVAIMAGFAICTEVLDLQGSRHDPVGNLVFSIGCIVSCAPIYQGLLYWNRARTQRADPGETLNGISGFFVAAAIGNLLAPQLSAPLTGLAGWQSLASVCVCAAVVILIGTAASISVIGGLLRDPRIWLVLAAIVAVGVTELTAILVDDDAARPLDRAVWLFAAVVITGCAMLAPGTGRAHAVNDGATVIGATVVLVCGVAVLAVNDELVLDKSRLATLFAATGVFAVSLRVLRLVQDLANLAQTRHEAMTDELTGVANRRSLLSAIDDALLTRRSTSLLIVDLDRFKAINDRYGHAAGDLLLQHMAETFVAHVPPGAFLARLGGDEFAVLLQDADIGEAIAVAHTLAHAAAPLPDTRGLLKVDVSVGVATIDEPGLQAGELLRRADTALYQAKISGSGVREYDRALDAAAQQRLSLVEDLHIALDGPSARDEEIVVYFQPQLKADTGEVVGAEALVRWAHPQLGLLAPDAFIDLAEQNGMMPSLTARVMREATAQAAVWRAAGHHLRVSVNLSATCLNDPNLLPLIDEVLGQGLDAEDLVLEVTETSLMTDPEQGLAALKRLAARGVGISIDDYGTGYSSLSYLNDLPATELKIDRSFTARTVNDPRTAAIVAGTVELAHRLGIRLVAEGVEDEATLTAMRELGCDETQGYLHSRPLPATVFLDWLGSRSVPPRLPAEPKLAANV